MPPAHTAVLHWGVKRPGRGGEWLAPPDNIKPENTTMPGGNSAETPFSACTGGRLLEAVPICQARCSLPPSCPHCGPPFLLADSLLHLSAHLTSELPACAAAPQTRTACWTGTRWTTSQRTLAAPPTRCSASAWRSPRATSWPPSPLSSAPRMVSAREEGTERREGAGGGGGPEAAGGRGIQPRLPASDGASWASRHTRGALPGAYILGGKPAGAPRTVPDLFSSPARPVCPPPPRHYVVARRRRQLHRACAGAPRTGRRQVAGL